MSPTVRHDPNPATAELDVVHGRRAPIAARVYACALLALALGTFTAFVLAGSPFPMPGPVLLLAIPLALCMNRFLFFPNEIGVTADAAVIFAAMVAFHDDALWLGPLVVALLVGPLDARHWGERAFVRMAYNSGSTALVTGVGLAVFIPLAHTFGASWMATAGAAAIATIPYVAAESALGIMLVVLLGERPRAAALHQLPLNSIAFPLAVLGALVGLAALDIGWWFAFVLLLPAPLSPELLFVTLPRFVRRRWRASPAVAWAALGAAFLVASVALPDAGAGFAAVACLVIAEHQPQRSTPVPPLAALLVVAPIAALGDAPVEAVLLAAAVGAAALVIIARAWWTLPVVAVAACVGRAWGMTGRFGALLFCAAMVATVFAAGVWGPPPWPSRVVGPMTGRRPHPHRRTVLLLGGFVTAGLATATTATAVTSPARVAFALATTALLEVAVTAAAFAVRMWRFAPRRRSLDAIALTTIGAVALLAYLPLALDDRPDRPALALAAICVIVTGAVAWPLARKR